MKYGQIAGNREINYAIYRCFEHLCDEDQQRFVKKFQKQPHDSDQIMHTFRELILGAYLSSRGFQVRYEYSVYSEAPDWCILNKKRAVVAIVELTNFRIDVVTENEIINQMQTKGIAVYWRDANKNNVDRLYHCIWDKMQKYKPLTQKLGAPYVIGIFPDFLAGLKFEEVRACLYSHDTGLFQMYRHVSGLLYFEEHSGQYWFRYEQNPNALRKFDLPSGVLWLAAEQEP